MAYYGLLMTAGMSVWLLVKRWRLAGWRTLLTSAGGLAVAAVVGVLLAAVYLLPLMELTAFSTRQVSLKSRDAYPLPNFLHALIDQDFLSHSYQILTQLRKVPSIFQLGKVPSILNTLIHQPLSPGVPWEYMVTPGLVVLALALFAVLTYWRKAWPLAIGVVLVAGLAMGNASPFYLLAARILPDFDRFRGLARIWFVALVLIALLAGLGTESLLRSLSRMSSHGTVVAGYLMVLVVAFTLVVTDMGYAHSNDVRVATTPSLLARTAAQLAGSERIYDVQRNIPQVSAVQLQICLADGSDPLLIEPYVSYMQSAGGYTSSRYQPQIPYYDSRWVQPNAVLLGLMHVSIVVSRRPLTDRHFVRVAKVDGSLIYKNTADAGSAYLVRPRQNGHPPSLDTTRVHTLVQTPEQDTFTFSTRTVEYFVIATPAFPGWTAELDGHPAPILWMAGAMPAIKVGPGMHTLSYIYAPLSVHLGAMLSVVGLLVALAWFIAGRCFKPGNPDYLCP
jgi:hypothetical protein